MHLKHEHPCFGGIRAACRRPWSSQAASTSQHQSSQQSLMWWKRFAQRKSLDDTPKYADNSTASASKPAYTEQAEVGENRATERAAAKPPPHCQVTHEGMRIKLTTEARAVSKAAYSAEFLATLTCVASASHRNVNLDTSVVHCISGLEPGVKYVQGQ
jgi:hypothetical protein